MPKPTGQVSDMMWEIDFSMLLSPDGKPGTFIHVEGEATLIHDKDVFEQHWVEDLERRFQHGVDTPGLVLVEARAKRIHYWAGEDEGVVRPA